MKKKLPAPRIQFRWTADKERGEGNWLCYYELVIPLGEHDVRREDYDKRGKLKKRPKTELVLEINGPTRRNSLNPPCVNSFTGERKYDAPFRDGAHAKWDGAVLGNPPVFAIALDGKAIKRVDEDLTS